MMFVHKRSDEGAGATLAYHLVQFALAALQRMVIGLSILFSCVCVGKYMFWDNNVFLDWFWLFLVSGSFEVIEIWLIR